jgi:hypothetical protein
MQHLDISHMQHLEVSHMQHLEISHMQHLEMRRKKSKWSFWGQTLIFGLFAIFGPYRH